MSEGKSSPEDWAGKRVLVTGGGGFIGSHLCERLVELGAETRTLVHYNALGSRGWLDSSPRGAEIEVVAGDVTDPLSVRGAMEGCDVVFHLAALIAIPYSYLAPSSFVHVNVLGTLNVLQAARDLGTPQLVHTSTSEVYGSAQRVPIDETHPLVGQSPYSASKIGADKLAESFFRSFGVPVVTVRPFNTFGPRQSARAVIPTIVSQCAAGATTIRLGSLTPTRDFNYVADTVEGFVLAGASEAARGQTLNLGSGREISIGDLARLIGELAGVELTVESKQERMRPEASEVDRLLACSKRAGEVLGWKPTVGLEEGLRRTLAWTRENLDRFRPNDYTV